VLKECPVQYPILSYYIDSSLGIAATNISGITLHSWAGIGIADLDIESLFFRLQNLPQVEWWEEADTLVIDEISMISGDLFDILNELGKRIRKNTRPFGGIQLILVRVKELVV
jgi:ATP-dependent DNA helicase PIF1